MPCNCIIAFKANNKVRNDVVPAEGLNFAKGDISKLPEGGHY